VLTICLEANRRILAFTVATLVAAVLLLALGAGPAQASQTDCLSYGYACTLGYTGANASGGWAWSHYGGGFAQTANGYHNCTLYAAWRLQQNGMPDPGNWGNAVSWASHNGGGDNTPAVGAIAWWGAEVAGGFGHVAYVDQVNGSQVHVMADNFPGSAAANGYTDSGWIAASSVDKFLHPHDLGAGGGGSVPAAHRCRGHGWALLGQGRQHVLRLGSRSHRDQPDRDVRQPHRRPEHQRLVLRQGGRPALRMGRHGVRDQAGHVVGQPHRRAANAIAT
jgi:surface antigen